jgi:hypothetical protein
LAGFGEKPTCVEYFKNLIDDINFHGKNGTTIEWRENGYWYQVSAPGISEDYQDTLPEFESIHFMNSLIVIHKRN